MALNNSPAHESRPYSQSIDQTEYGAFAVDNVQPLNDETSLIMNPDTLLYGSANVSVNFNPSENSRSESYEDSISMSIGKHITRAMSLPDQMDDFFLRDDDYDDDDDADIPQASKYQDLDTLTYQWKFRHTISYWISIALIFGSLGFTVGSIFFLIEAKLSPKDVYTLVTYLYFSGSFAFLIGTYLAYYQMLNERSSRDYKKRDLANAIAYKYLWLYGKKTTHFWNILCLLLGTATYHVAVTFEVLNYDFKIYSLHWYCLKFLPLWLGGFAFFVSGYLQMKLNKYWLWRPYKLGWVAAWLNGVGGFLFFVGGFGAFWHPGPPWIAFYFLQLPYFVGSALYLVSSILCLYMWKLQQFGLTTLPHLNKQNKSYKKPEKDIILNRDIVFIVFYNLSAMVGFIGIAYSWQCVHIRNWVKDFMEKIYASVGILILGSFLHREPEKPPFNYLIWFLRIFIIITTVNLFINTSQARTCYGVY